jgi:hypothetical protein
MIPGGGLVLGLAASALLPATGQGETLPLPKAGLRIDYQATVVVERGSKQRVEGIYSMLVTCGRPPYVATFRIHRTGSQKTTSRLITYRNVTPVSLLLTLPRGRTLKRRYFFPRDVIDGYLKSGGRTKVTFATGDAPLTGGDPIKTIRRASQVTLQPLRKETVTVPAGRYETVVLNSITVSRPPARSIEKIVVDATGWFSPKLGYPVKIVIRQTITGEHAQKVLQTFLASKIGRESPPIDGCNDVPAK